MRPGGRQGAAVRRLCKCGRECQQRPAAAAIVVGARLLHVRREHDALLRLDRSGNLGDERPVGPLVERRLDVDLDLDWSALQALTHARRRAPARLEAEGLGFGVVRDRAPLKNVVLVRRGEELGIGRADIRGHAGGDHSDRAASFDGVLPQPAGVGVAEDDGALHVQVVVLSSAGFRRRRLPNAP